VLGLLIDTDAAGDDTIAVLLAMKSLNSRLEASGPKFEEMLLGMLKGTTG
jgi:hypothetical protein